MLPRTLIPQTEAEAAQRPRAVLGAPKYGEHDGHFDDLLLDQAIKPRKPFDIFISAGVHLAIVGAILMAPMLFARQMVLAKGEATYLVAPTLPVAPAAAPRAVVAKTTFHAPDLSVPLATPKVNETASVVQASAPDLSNAMSGVNGGVEDGVLGGILGGGASGPAVPEGHVGTLRVGGQVQRPELVYNPDPEYPREAKKQKIQGVVKIDAIVDTDGNVVQAHAISGPALLIDAALKAVTQWKYEPTYLNGKPYPLELIVDVNFHLGGQKT